MGCGCCWPPPSAPAWTPCGGVTLAFLEADILVTALAIGAATSVMATAGLLLGRWLGGRFGRVAEGLGGLGLVPPGLGILAEHTLGG